MAQMMEVSLLDCMVKISLRVEGLIVWVVSMAEGVEEGAEVAFVEAEGKRDDVTTEEFPATLEARVELVKAGVVAPADKVVEFFVKVEEGTLLERVLVA